MPEKVRKTAGFCLCGEKEYALGFCHPHYLEDYRKRNSDSLSAKAKARRKSNATKILAAKRAYREANRDELARKQREYAAANPEIVRRNAEKSNRARRARILGVPSERYSADDVLTMYGTDCHLCKLPIDLDAPRRIGREGWELGLHIDHHIPLAKGGDNTLANARPAHGACNLRKGSVG